MQKITWVPATETQPGQWQFDDGVSPYLLANFRGRHDGKPVIVFQPQGATTPLVCDDSTLTFIEFGEAPIALEIDGPVAHSSCEFSEFLPDSGLQEPVKISPVTLGTLVDHLNGLDRFGLTFLTKDKVTIVHEPALTSSSKYTVNVDGFGWVGVLDKPVVEKLELFHIWIEGYQAQGSSGRARFEGSATAANFKEACLALMSGNEYYRPDSNTWWGCRLFDNEQDARKAFG